jgi:hypothetical protein
MIVVVVVFVPFTIDPQIFASSSYDQSNKDENSKEVKISNGYNTNEPKNEMAKIRFSSYLSPSLGYQLVVPPEHGKVIGLYNGILDGIRGGIVEYQPDLNYEGTDNIVVVNTLENGAKFPISICIYVGDSPTNYHDILFENCKYQPGDYITLPN